MKKTNITSFSDHLDKQYGNAETKSRQEYEEGFETFMLGAMLQESRKEKG